MGGLGGGQSVDQLPLFITQPGRYSVEDAVTQDWDEDGITTNPLKSLYCRQAQSKKICVTTYLESQGNGVKKKSDTFNKSMSSLKTKKEEERQRKKAPDDDTVKNALFKDPSDRKKIENKKPKPTPLFAKSKRMFMKFQHGFKQ